MVRALLLLGAGLCSALLPVRADVTMPAIFGDHMVLQQDAKLPVWGSARPGEKVKVTLGADSLEATAGADGAWRVEFPPHARPTGDAAQTLTVAGKNTLTFQDVLIGDVWLASGQSNMAFGIAKENRGAESIASADLPKIRLFVVAQATALEPQASDKLHGEWVVCTPKSLRAAGAEGFSAVAFYFGREISRVTGRPVGLIGSYWGGTPAQAWTSLSGLQKEPTLADYVAEHQKYADGFAAASGNYPKLKADYDAANKAWFTSVGKDLDKQVDAWQVDAAEDATLGKPAPPMPRASAPKPVPPIPPDGGQRAPTTLFNAMIAPLMPYAIKGVIWYQGEANVKRESAVDYPVLFARLITDWREKWGEGDFPFLFVQLANLSPAPKTPVENSGYPLVREGQMKALALPNTGMAVTIEIGNPFNVHPKDKLDVGLRLALAARHVVYGEDIVYTGPLYQTMKVEGGKIRLTFTGTGSGLTLGVPPWTPSGKPPVPPKELTGFAIAGADKKWAWAHATIDGNSVVVGSDQVAQPVAVRYGWASGPLCNLYNHEGLPASPFRTDDWTEATPRPLTAAPETTPTAP